MDIKMKKRRWKIFAAVFAMALLFTGCSGAEQDSGIAGNTYIYEKEGIGGDFAIDIFEDGTFSYYEGMLSSYIGFGSWTLDGDTLLLTEREQLEGQLRVNYFKVDGNDLVFLAENSSNFVYVKVADGERFSEKPAEQ